MQQQITDIVDGIIQKLEVYGLKETTIQQYRKGFFNPIIRYFAERNTHSFDYVTIEAIQTKYHKAFENGSIKRRHYTSMVRALNYIMQYADTGDVDFARIINTKRFSPNTTALSIIASVLERTTLKDAFKYKLDCILRKFFCYMEERGYDIHDVSTDIIRDFITYASTTNAGSMEYVIYALRILLEYLNSENIAEIILDVRYFAPNSNPSRIIVPFTGHEVSALLAQINTNTVLGKRNNAIILLSSGTGLRGIDILNLKLLDINWKLGELYVIQSKTRKSIALPVTGQILNAISDYILNGRPKSDCQNVFLRSNAPYTALKGVSALDVMIDSLCIKAGVEKKQHRSFHSLRRSLGTWMANEQVSLTTIFQLLGHSNVDSSKPYLSFNDEQMRTCALGFEDIPLIGGAYA